MQHTTGFMNLSMLLYGYGILSFNEQYYILYGFYFVFITIPKKSLSAQIYL